MNKWNIFAKNKADGDEMRLHIKNEASVMGWTVVYVIMTVTFILSIIFHDNQEIYLLRNFVWMIISAYNSTQSIYMYIKLKRKFNLCFSAVWLVLFVCFLIICSVSLVKSTAL